MTNPSSQQAPLILFAMKEETQFLKDAATSAGWRVSKVDGHRRLAKGDRFYDVIISGPGRKNVLEALAGRTPELIVNPGFAGSINPRFNLGDLTQIVCARSGPQLLEAPETSINFVDSSPARIVTAPVPIGKDDKMTMHRHDAGDLVDMETFHVLEFCKQREIPYVGLRVVSDGLHEELPEVVTDSYDGRKFHIGKIIRRAIFSGSTRKELLKLRRNSQMAAKKLAKALIAAL